MRTKCKPRNRNQQSIQVRASWNHYESAKAQILATAQTATEYEQRLKALLRKLGL